MTAARKPSDANGPIRLGVSAALRNDLERLCLIRRLRWKTGEKATIRGIIDAAVMSLISRQRRGVVHCIAPPLTCVPLNARIGVEAQRRARAASARADVRLTDFLRTALIMYLERHARELEGLPKQKRASHTKGAHGRQRGETDKT